ncbi:MAG: putative bifunctional diguanylate cyclase/phosphodiesterase [Thermoleophilaceae bacterium]
MRPDAVLGSSAAERARQIERRLQRERLARHEAEQIAERTTRALYDRQRELRLLEAVVSVSNEGSSLDEVLQGVVDVVCDHTGWPVGHAYTRDASSGDLVPTGIWHTDQSEQFAAFRRVTERTSFARGVGLPGRVLDSGEAAWVPDTESDPNFPRRELGVRGAFAFPIVVDGEVEVVVEFFSASPVAPDADLLQVMAQIGRQLGRVLERIRARQQIAHQATHDALTGLPNRILFRDRLEHALERAERQGTFAAVLFVDLDRFKLVNDSLGHAVGDQLLKQVAGRLKTALRSTDTLARFGGDEFVVLCEDLTWEGETVRLAERIQRSLLSPFMLDREDHTVTASIGVALTNGGAGDPESTLRDADIAMYRAKERGTGHWELFDEALRNRALQRLATERALRVALDESQLRLFYQPIVSLKTGAIESVEALVRWEHPDRGLVFPADFIPIAEESALILQIGAWTLREACEQARDWRNRFGDMAPLPVSVNLSARQLAQSELPSIVGKVLSETGVSPSDLALEVTETALVESSTAPAASLESVKALGVRILLDDFGTGYSSLSHLQRFPIDVLKVDRSFVERLSEQNGGSAIVAGIAALAGALGLGVIAEGVETAEQAKQVRALGCGQAQGYHFGRPGPADQIESLLGSGEGGIRTREGA